MNSTRTQARRPFWHAFALGSVVLGLAACGGSNAFQAGSSSTPAPAAAGSGSGGALTVGGGNFTEMLVMQQIYGQLLTKAGFTITYKTADNREIYAKSLSSGEIDVVPEYAATFAEYLNRAANGPDAKPVATNDPAQTVSAMAPLAAKQGLSLLQPAAAADQNGFAVTKTFASANKVTTLSQLGALAKPVRLAAVVECPDRPFCQPGLEKTYGITVSQVQPLGFDSPQAKQAVIDGTADLVLVGTTDATLDGLGLVLLQDDKKLQLADNLIPVVNTAAAGNATVSAALNSVASLLTTADLTALDAQVDAQRDKPADVAKAWLGSKGLL